jgi:hypothetical protein
MIIFKKQPRILFVLAVLLIAAGILLLPLHHHEDGTERPDCPLCRVSQHLGFLLVVFFILNTARAVHGAFPAGEARPRLFFLASILRTRAPPVLF